MSDIVQDLRFALRTLARAPGFAALAVLILGLGIGATGAVFSLVDAYLLRPLPFPHADRLVAVSDAQPDHGDAPIAYQEFRDLEEHGGMLEAVVASSSVSRNYTGGDLPERLRVLLVSEHYFELIGATPSAGRFFLPDEEREGAPPTVGVTEGVWPSRLGGRPDAIGGVIHLNDRPHAVAGVVPDPALGNPASPIAVYLPLAANAPWRDAGTHYLQVRGRQPRGSTLDATRGELAALAARLQQDRGTTHGFSVVSRGVRGRRVAPGRDRIPGELAAGAPRRGRGPGARASQRIGPAMTSSTPLEASGHE